jgi:mannitol/fructose-specific phosphotransferase system IIA component (Ntr-type)
MRYGDDAMGTRETIELAVALADIFPPQAVVAGVCGADRAAVVRELVGRLVQLGRLPPADEEPVVLGILAREAVGSSTLGGGVAMPNCRTSATKEFVGAVGLVPEGVSFDARGEPVYGVFLLVAPLDRRDRHFEILGRVAALGADKTQRLRLRGCRTAEDVHSLLRELDRR